MSVINYKKLHKNIVDGLTNYSNKRFTYIERANWVDAEGKFLASRVGNAFTVAVSDKGESDLDDPTAKLLKVDIEFVLSAEHDNYLTDLGHCEQAVVGINDLEFDDEVSINVVESNFECEFDTETRLVKVIFDSIYFII